MIQKKCETNHPIEAYLPKMTIRIFTTGTQCVPHFNAKREVFVLDKIQLVHNMYHILSEEGSL
jgi:hypothetical protein